MFQQTNTSLIHKLFEKENKKYTKRRNYILKAYIYIYIHQKYKLIYKTGCFKRPTPGFRRQGGLEPSVQVSGNPRAQRAFPAQEQERIGGVFDHRALPDVGLDQEGSDYFHHRVRVARSSYRADISDIFYVT